MQMLNIQTEHLLPKEYQTKSNAYWESRVLAPSAFILYTSELQGKINTNSNTTTLLFTKNWEHGFSQIFKSPEWPDDPSMYICMPSKTDARV
jgi:phytoene dehydrogenase-like protein